MMEKKTVSDLRAHLSGFESEYPIKKGYISHLILNENLSSSNICRKIKEIVQMVEPDRQLHEGRVIGNINTLKKILNFKKKATTTYWTDLVNLNQESFCISFDTQLMDMQQNTPDTPVDIVGSTPETPVDMVESTPDSARNDNESVSVSVPVLFRSPSPKRLKRDCDNCIKKNRTIASMQQKNKSLKGQVRALREKLRGLPLKMLNEKIRRKTKSANKWRARHSGLRTELTDMQKKERLLHRTEKKSCIKEEQCSVIHFLISEGIKPLEIHRRMKVQYGDACLSIQQVFEWSRKFQNGVSSMTDCSRPGQAHRVVTPEPIAVVDRLVQENCWWTVSDIATHLDISRGSAHNIIHDVLQYHKVSARWVPRQPTPELKQLGTDAHQELLQRFEEEGDGFLSRIVEAESEDNTFFDKKTKQDNPRSVLESVKVGMKRKNVPSSSKAQAKKKARKQSSPSETYSHWLIKSEPGSRYEQGIDMKFSFDDLKTSPDQIASWDGVRNYQARNFLRDQMKRDHEAFFYHSNCKNPGIVGICKVVRESYPDHTQFDSDNPHYDSTSKEDNPKWYMVDVKYERPLNRYISLAELKKIHQEHTKSGGPLQNMALFTRARLSVQPLTQEEWDFIIHLEDKEPGDVEDKEMGYVEDKETINGTS